MLKEYLESLEICKNRFAEMRVSLEYDQKLAQLQKAENDAADPALWEESSRVQNYLKKQGALREQLRPLQELEQMLEELALLLELVQQETDGDDLIQEAKTIFEEVNRRLDQMELETLFSGEYDFGNAIMALHPGAGGLESQDWAEMLLRMYNRWAEQKGFEVELVDLLPGDEAGLKSATMIIRGHAAYGYLQAEKGVHRMIRISPFDTARRRHTSFASVDVIPEVEDEAETAINPEDLKIDTYRASGAGGQHVNKTDSAVRITHLPTGIVVCCQNERSQHSNRQRAMHILQARLAELQRQVQEQELSNLRGHQKEIAWGSQIRTYTFHPFTLVKDHRTGMEVGQVDAVMDGSLDPFIEAFLKWKVRAMIAGRPKSAK
ncbi:MAG: peptide chain release factor 2 [Bacillota bacterium]